MAHLLCPIGTLTAVSSCSGCSSRDPPFRCPIEPHFRAVVLFQAALLDPGHEEVDEEESPDRDRKGLSPALRRHGGLFGQHLVGYSEGHPAVLNLDRPEIVSAWLISLDAITALSSFGKGCVKVR